MTHPFNPEMLTLARMSRGLTQTDLAHAIETTQGRLSKIEHGFFVPPEDLVERLARELKYPRDFFFQPGYMNTLPSWFHRKRKHLSQITLGRIHADIAIRVRNIAKLLMQTDVKAVLKLPQLDIDQFEGNAEQVAQTVREQWALPRGPIQNLVEMLERAGVLLRRDLHRDLVVEARRGAQAWRSVVSPENTDMGLVGSAIGRCHDAITAETLDLSKGSSICLTLH